MRISTKQASLLTEIKEAPQTKVSELFLFGPVGTSKTYGAAYALCNIAWQFPNSFIPVGRTTLADARIGTAMSFLEVLDDMNLIEGRHYRFINSAEVKFVFTNGSIIQFLPLDWSTDREWKKLKSVNATAGMIDEVDSVVHSGYTMFTSRIGRRNKNGAPAICVMTCNPSEGWVKDEVYTPWREDRLAPDKRVIEFEMRDSFLYGEGFYDRYQSNPEQWKQRYLYNNWEYLDDEKSLFKARVLDGIMTDDWDPDAERYAANDVAREGTDRSVFARINGETLTDIKILSREDIERKATLEQRHSGAIPYGVILGTEFMGYCEKYAVGYQNAAVDAVGNGAGVVDHCRNEGFNVNEFKAGSAPIGKDLERSKRTRRKPEHSTSYDMLRSQVYHLLAQAMENGKFRIWRGCPYVSELKKELLYHQVETKDKILTVERKDQIKKRLGHSPDIADAVAMAYYNKVKLPDTRYNASRISWSGKAA